MAMASAGIGAYMNQFLDVASKGRVKYMSQRYGQIQGKPTTFHMFRCTHCHDNLHLAEHVIASSSSIPQELQDWVLKHRHICSSFKLSPLNGPNQKYTGVDAEGNPNAWKGWCASCGWPGNEHVNSPGYAPQPVGKPVNPAIEAALTGLEGLILQQKIFQQLKHPANQHIVSANFKIKEMIEAAKLEAKQLEEKKKLEEHVKKLKAYKQEMYQQSQVKIAAWDGQWSKTTPAAVPEPKPIPTVPQHAGRKFR